MNRLGPIWIIAALVGVGAYLVVAGFVATVLYWILFQTALAIAILALFMAYRYEPGQSTIEFFDVGTLFISVAFVYTFLPLANYIRLDGIYPNRADGRMVALQPSPDLIARVGWHYILFMAAFAAVYLYSQNRFRAPAPNPNPPREGFVAWMILLFGVCQFVMFSLKSHYNLKGDTYLESYRVYQDVSVGVQQTMGWLTGFSRVLEISILASFFARYQRYRVVVWVWLTGIAVATVLRLHARTDLMIALASAVFLYHVFVTQVRLVRLAAIGIAVVLAFQALGVLRGLEGNVDDLGTHEMVNSGSEFESIFGNAVHVTTIRDSGEAVLSPGSWYLSEICMLVPQQLLPFPKVDPSSWYVRTYFPRYAALGGGYAWGVIAQCAAGFGLVEAIVRGALLAYVLLHISRYLRTRWHRLEFVVIYTWLMATIYLSMRNVTFNFVHGALYFVVPWLLVCHTIERTAPQIEAAPSVAFGAKPEPPRPSF